MCESLEFYQNLCCLVHKCLVIMVEEFGCPVQFQIIHELQFRDDQLVKLGLHRKCICAMLIKKYERKRELISKQVAESMWEKSKIEYSNFMLV